MKQLNVYLNFPGNCREALEFYKHCLNGHIPYLQTFGEAPVETHEANRDKVMHATFEAEGISFMASDSLPEHGGTHPGTMVSLSLNLDNETEQTEIFNRLAEGGQVGMPLNDTFWGARFGMVTDKYGVPWMLNCDKRED